MNILISSLESWLPVVLNNINVQDVKNHQHKSLLRQFKCIYHQLFSYTIKASDYRQWLDILYIYVVCIKIIGKYNFYVYSELEIGFENDTLGSAKFGTLVYLK